ncbi:hypothetical protein SMICM17S_07362 [Streptomyces microflavus]
MSKAFTVTREAACPRPRPTSLAATVYSARRSAWCASRMATATCRGRERAIVFRLSFSQES